MIIIITSIILFVVVIIIIDDGDVVDHNEPGGDILGLCDCNGGGGAGGYGLKCNGFW